MAKVIDICILCGARKLLNYAGLCKRCNKDPAAREILEDATKQQQAAQEAALADAAKAAEEPAEAEASEGSEEEKKEEAPAEEKKK